MVRGGIRLICGLVVGLLLTGCNSEQGGLAPDDAAEQIKQNSLVETAELLRLYNANHQNKSPSKATDLATYEVGYPSGYLKVKQGNIVVVWNTRFEEGASDKIIAYEKEAPESGGYVLMQDGTTVKKLTADEFKAAPKAAGAGAK
ncbi:hypothetical protein SAMN05444166_1747 [Singulisphaera sp. GP187]|uniref:hypothetical protein n=1 Tax=Singulisphaera sp. GP187 TaxID=1882752 RepID=UPI00092A20F4|nr:hypothetical protein [Singulisphaera sp. GP187]SIN94983.1 hypothetical protein SAMN05444166_1747 [Singulisphaera sp. GP187]